MSALPAWEQLGRTQAARQAAWRRCVRTPLTERALAAVRRSVVTGRLYGEASWVERVAAAVGLRLTPRPRGRPRKEAKI